MRPILGVALLLVALIAITTAFIAYGNMTTLTDPDETNASLEDFPIFRLYSSGLLPANGGDVSIATLARQLQRRIMTVGGASIFLMAIALLLILSETGKHPSVGPEEG